MIRFIFHLLIKKITKKKYQIFKNILKEPELAQRNILKKITGMTSYEDFKLKYPLTSYIDWQDEIEKARLINPGAHYVPTSGSTFNVKWIPYTQKFKSELWNASSVWIHDLYVRHPALKNGTHFWSLSWIPTEMRSVQKTNDLDLFIGLEKMLLSQTMAMTSLVANLPTLKESMRESLLILIEKNVTLISIWSPTFLLEILDQVFTDKKYFLEKISDKRKIFAIESNTSLNSQLMSTLFPSLALISSWDTSSSSYYAEKIKILFPDVKFEAKGVWATEGVVTIPLEEKFPLAVNSHFYEFEDVESGLIYPSWELQVGMKVSPILTTGSLIYRYKMHDMLLVSEFMEKTPCFKFLGRQNTTDLVGEKISSELAQELINEINEEFQVTALSLFAIQNERPHYRLLIDGVDKISLLKLINESLENKLLAHFHYKLARELNQLSIAEVVMEEKAYIYYIKSREKTVTLKGNIKIEPLIMVTE